jgi:hypothetical protein
VELFTDATLEELQEIDQLIDAMPGYWVSALLEWAEGHEGYFRYSAPTAAQWMVGVIRNDITALQAIEGTMADAPRL